MAPSQPFTGRGVLPSSDDDFDTFYSPLEWLDALLARGPTELDKCIVEHVGHYMRTSRKQYEFLIIQVGLINRPEKAHIVARRAVKIENCDHLLNLSLSSIFSPDLLTVDGVACAYAHSDGYDKLVRRWRLDRKGTSKLIGQLNFPASLTRPSILQLATLIMVTDSHADTYSAIEHQCHWLAFTVMGALKKLFPGAEPSKEYHREGTHWGIDEPMVKSIEQVCDEHAIKFSAALKYATEMENMRVEKFLREHREHIDRAHADGIKAGHDKVVAKYERVLGAEIVELVRRCE